VLWAVAVPAIQATALAVVFSHFIRRTGGFSYSAYAVTGVLAWGYFNLTIATGSVAIVVGSDLTDKIWFPRSLLVFVPSIANLPGSLISFGLFVVALPLLGAEIAPHTLFLIPALLLLVAFSTALALVLAALHVYFRDVRYLVQASLLVLFYATPIAYPQRSVGSLAPWLNLNPLTGIANLFHLAAVGRPDLWTDDLVLSIVISIVVTLLLSVAALEVHRRYDRLFVDLL
jgi:ABC-type polysaccharide/polyol phosphate export permease